MSTTEHAFRPVHADDLPAIVALLDACGLPTDDLASAGRENFELAVAPDWRGRRLGEQLVSRREAAARAAAVSRLYLLTTTAADFFRRQGYLDVKRAEVPAAIAAHAQFRSLCPASACCLGKGLQTAAAID